jgi:hypothetical protein
MNMSRFAPYIEALVVLLVGIVAVMFANSFTVVTTTKDAHPLASSTVAIVPAIPVPQLSVPDLSVIATTTLIATTTSSTVPATTTSEKPKPSVPNKVAKAPAPAASPAASVTPTPAPATLPSFSSGSVSLDTSASRLRSALVNIICYAPLNGTLHSISGSGVIIDSKGTILTNAHVAQYFLLTDRGVDCTVRTGSPAVDSYTAALIYISPLWVRANSAVLTEAAPTGTGEYDFALLGITGSATGAALPASYPFIPLADLPAASGTPVVIASYGAQFLQTSQVESSLFPTVVFGSVKDIYTFAINTIDVLALGGSAAAQEGSSGGGVSDSSGKLVATITTSTVEGETATRSLNAITASYIRGEYASEMGSPLDLLLAESVSQAVSEFKPEIRILEPILTAQLH